MFVFKHPKYYKELRDAGNELAPASAVKEDLTSSGSSPARNKSDQAISQANSTRGLSDVRPGPGLRGQAKVLKLQAPSSQSLKLQAASIKPQAQRLKLKAASNKLVDHGPLKKFQAP